MRFKWMLGGVAVLLACSGDVTTPTDYVGVYSASRVNGQALPAVVDPRSSLPGTLVSGTLTVNANGTWRFDQTVRYTAEGKTFDRDPQPTDQGTYAIEGGELRFSNPQPNGDPFVASVSATGITWKHGLMVAYPFETLEFTRK